MADKKAAATGLWSSTSTWDGGTLPNPGDDVYANNFAVSIDQDVDVNRLRKVSGTGITAGGSFVITTAATVDIASGIAAADNVTNSTHLLQVNAGSATVTINAAITGGAASSRKAVVIASGFTGILNLNGNVVGGAGSGGGCHAVFSSGAGTINLTGDVTGGVSTALSHSDAASTLNVVGTVTGGANPAIESADATTNITGDVHGGSSTYGTAVDLFAGACTVRGNIYPGTAEGNSAIRNNGGAALAVSGAMYMGGTEASTGPDGFLPINGPWVKIAGEDLAIHILDDDGEVVDLGEGGGGGPSIPSSGVIWPPRYY